MAKKAPKSFDTEQCLAETAEKLREVLRSIETHGDGEHQSTIGDIARVATALTTTCAELRQHAKAAARAIADIPLEQLLAHIKTLPEQVRQDFCRDVLGSDDQEPLL